MIKNNQQKLAVLIDADNSQSSIIEGLLDEIAQYGVSSVKRIYGDWTDTRLKKWKAKLLENGIQPIQQFAYTTGKNATDSAMIIDAMDLLYTDKFDGFCIVSSDSDFTRLASRIREAGLRVYGFGEKKTPKAFMSACDKFIYTENLRKADIKNSHSSTITTKIEQSRDELQSKKSVAQLLKNAVEDTADDSGWSSLASVGQNIANKASDFDSRNYGFKKLRDLLESYSEFEMKEDTLSGFSQGVYVRMRREKRTYQRSKRDTY